MPTHANSYHLYNLFRLAACQLVVKAGKVGPSVSTSPGSCRKWIGSLMRFVWIFGSVCILFFNSNCQDLTQRKLVAQVPPRKPKAGSRLPSKGTLVQKPMVVKAFGTIRHAPRCPDIALGSKPLPWPRTFWIDGAGKPQLLVEAWQRCQFLSVLTISSHVNA